MTDVDGVFTKRLVSSENFGCWCEMLIRGPFPTDGILFLREFGVEVLSILTTSHLALASSGVVLFFWFGGFGAFASVCQTYVAMPSGWHSITQDWKGAIKGAVRVLKDPFQHMTFLHPSWSRYHCTQSNSVHVSLYEFPTILPGYPVPYLHPRAHPCVPSKNVGNKLTNFVSSCIFPLILPRQFVSSTPLHH